MAHGAADSLRNRCGALGEANLVVASAEDWGCRRAVETGNAAPVAFVHAPCIAAGVIAGSLWRPFTLEGGIKELWRASEAPSSSGTCMTGSPAKL